MLQKSYYQFWTGVQTYHKYYLAPIEIAIEVDSKTFDPYGTLGIKEKHEMDIRLFMGLIETHSDE